MTTWEYADNSIRHPWFTSSLKRKHTESSEEDDDASITFAISDIDSGTGSNAIHFGGHNPYTVEEEQDIYTTPPSTATVDRPFSKRRRCDTIERKMARMQIGQETQSRIQPMPGVVSGVVTSQNNRSLGDFHPQAPGMMNATSASSVYSTYSNFSNTSLAPSTLDDLNPAHIYHPSMVEEPTSPEIVTQGHLPATFVATVSRNLESTDDVRMKGDGPASYERERDRIVITDLDEAIAEAEAEERLAKAANPSISSFNDEDGYKPETDPHPYADEYADSNADFSISEILLEHIKRQANFPYKDPATLPKMRNEAQVGALVLFRPPPPPPIQKDVVAAVDAEKARRDEERVREETAKNFEGGLSSPWSPSDDSARIYRRDIEVESVDGGSTSLSGDFMSTPMEEDAMEVEL